MPVCVNAAYIITRWACNNYNYNNYRDNEYDLAFITIAIGKIDITRAKLEERKLRNIF